MGLLTAYYIQTKQIINLPNFGQTLYTYYQYEKTGSNIIDDSIQDAWDARSGTKYYIVNEHPYSQIYHRLESIGVIEIVTNEKFPGYAGPYKIVDAHKAIQDVQIPVMAGRDLMNLEVQSIDGKEYLILADFVYISEKDIPDLYAGKNAICTIQKNGYARWYTVNQKDAGKTMIVDLPKNGSFAVYDEESCIYFSVVDGNRPVVLPEKGRTVFIGESPGDRFVITTDFAENLGEYLYKQALSLEKEGKLTQAAGLCEKALPLLSASSNPLAFDCGEALQRVALIQETYPYTRDEIKELISKTYSQVTEETIDGWIENKELESFFYDGEDHYFVEAASNLIYRHIDLMYANEIYQEVYYGVVQKINELNEEEPENTWQQYQKPVTYHGTHTISIPREELPETGTYRLWIPLPINGGPQTQVTVDYVTPEKWVKQPPSIDDDIGLLYMEIPMEELTEDLLIQVKFSFTHYEQRFTIDPQNIGQYDKDSYIYKEYTKSYGNTEITPEIREKAREIVGDETNPYFAARKIYDYIVNNVDYAIMPHQITWPKTSLTELDYVHEYYRGDCGAQSMYFTALCRSIGIPARTTGGYQLMFGEFGGHFWAEFYLPNYGWIPVDTSMAQTALFTRDADAEQKQTFIDYYFGNQDSMRCVVQKDTDVEFIPRAKRMFLMPMVVQFPAAEYSMPTGEVDYTFLNHWTLTLDKY